MHLEPTGPVAAGLCTSRDSCPETLSTMDAPTEALPRPGLESLPKELLLIIFDYDSISLVDLYRLRWLCRAVGPLSSEALIRRVGHVLRVQKDLHQFLRFMDEIQDVDSTDDEAVVEEGVHNANSLRPFSVGRLLKAAGIPIDAYVVGAIAQHHLNGGVFGVCCVGGFYRAMGAGFSDIRLAVQALDLHTQPRIELLQLFLRHTGLPGADIGDLYVSLDNLAFSTRWEKAAEAKRWHELPESEFARTALPRFVKEARKEFGDGTFFMVNNINSFIAFVKNMANGRSFTLEEVLASSTCLLPAEKINMLLTNSPKALPDLRLIERYLHNPRHPCGSGSSFSSASVEASVDESRAFFAQLEKDRPVLFMDFVSLFVRDDRWPRHVDLESLDFRSGELRNGFTSVETICRHLRGKTIPTSEVVHRLTRFCAFIRGNFDLDRVQGLKKHMESSLEDEMKWPKHTVNDGRPLLSVLLDAANVIIAQHGL